MSHNLAAKLSLQPVCQACGFRLRDASKKREHVISKHLQGSAFPQPTNGRSCEWKSSCSVRSALLGVQDRGPLEPQAARGWLALAAQGGKEAMRLPFQAHIGKEHPGVGRVIDRRAELEPQVDALLRRCFGAPDDAADLELPTLPDPPFDPGKAAVPLQRGSRAAGGAAGEGGERGEADEGPGPEDRLQAHHPLPVPHGTRLLEVPSMRSMVRCYAIYPDIGIAARVRKRRKAGLETRPVAATT